MDTRAPPTPVGVQDDTKEAGASYAHAVLNFKQTNNSTNNNNNKENIEEPGKDNIVQLVDSSKQPEEPKQIIPDEEDTFTPVVSHSRKERKNEKKKKLAATSDKHDKGEHPLREKGKESRSGPKEKRDEKEPSAVRDLGEDQSDSKKVFVEAPIPKVNPWQVKQALPSTQKEEATTTVAAATTAVVATPIVVATPVVAATTTVIAAPAATTVVPTASTEKRVLQPKNKEIVDNGPEVSGVVKAPRDKRRYNQKVFIIKLLPVVINEPFSSKEIFVG